jgi:hypothetical protein
MADEMLALIHTFDKSFELRYNKHYIGLARNNQPMNFAAFRPRKNTTNVGIQLSISDDIDKKLADAGLDILEFDARNSRYRISLGKTDINKNAALLTNLFRAAYDDRAA